MDAQLVSWIQYGKRLDQSRRRHAGGLAGTVKSVTLFATELCTPDNVQIIAPNGQIWSSAIKNYSFHATRRVDFLFGIGYADNIDAAMDLILATANADERVHQDPAPMVAVGELADSSVNIILRVWCSASDYWGLKFDLTKSIKQRFDDERRTEIVDEEGDFQLEVIDQGKDNGEDGEGPQEENEGVEEHQYEECPYREGCAGQVLIPTQSLLLGARA